MAYKWDEMVEYERNRLVAVNIMNHTNDEFEFFWPAMFNFTTCISDAWEVVKKMRIKHFSFEISTSENNWIAKFLPWPIVYTDAIASTAPEAICKAALKAIGVEIE